MAVYRTGWAALFGFEWLRTSNFLECGKLDGLMSYLRASRAVRARMKCWIERESAVELGIGSAALTLRLKSPAQAEVSAGD